MESKEFSRWLEATMQSFSNLSDIQRSITLKSLIQDSGPVQMYYLSELQNLMRRDFLRWLPHELAYRIIMFLDIDTLKTCCLVSKHWNQIISGCAEVWFHACCQLGLKREYDILGKGGTYWKKICKSLSSRMDALKHGSAFTVKVLHGHTESVTALYYSKGYLASGSGDFSVRIWNMENGECEKIIEVNCSCSDIKFDGSFLVTASFNCTIGLWDMETGNNIRMYVGHTSAVLCVDLDVDSQIIASGSADKTVKIWSLNSDTCYKSFCGHRSWVSKVILKPSLIDSATHRQGDLVLLSMDEHNVKIWPILGESNECLKTLEPPSFLTTVVYQLQFLQFNGSTIICTFGHGCHIWNFKNLQHVMLIGMDQGISVQGYGSTFILHNWLGSLIIRNTSDYEKLAQWKNTHFHSRERQCCTVGDTGWLDGWDLVPQNGVVFATAAPSNSIVMVKWV